MYVQVSAPSAVFAVNARNELLEVDAAASAVERRFDLVRD